MVLRFTLAASLLWVAPQLDAQEFDGESVAERPSQQDPRAADQVRDDQIREWIDRLESPRFRDRAEATVRLERSGIRAIDALRQTVLTDDGHEARDRAFEILRRHRRGEDPLLSRLAEQALREIAEGRGPKAKAAGQLTDNTHDVGLGQIPIAIPALVPPPLPRLVNRRTRIEVKVVNGRKEVIVEENGKTIQVADKGDVIEVEKKDDKGTTKRQYRDVAELRAKDPEAHRAFHRAGGIQIRGNQGGETTNQANRHE